jgi:hypothetical protein
VSQPPPETSVAGKERRRSPRFEVLGRVLGTLVSVDLPVRVRDVGLGGFSVETVEPLDTGVVHPVRFTAMDDWSAVLPATSLHCRPSVAPDGTPRYVTGFAFATQEAAGAARTIHDLITKVTSVRLFEEATED